MVAPPGANRHPRLLEKIERLVRVNPEAAAGVENVVDRLLELKRPVGLINDTHPKMVTRRRPR